MQSRNLSRSLAESWLWHQRMVMAQTFSMIGMFAPLFRVKNWIWPDSWVTLTCFLVFFLTPSHERSFVTSMMTLAFACSKRLESVWNAAMVMIRFYGLVVPTSYLTCPLASLFHSCGLYHIIYIYISLSLVSFIWLVRFDPIRWYWTFAAWMMTSVGTWRVRTVRSCL